MNFIQQFQAIFSRENRHVAKIIALKDGGYLARTHAGNEVRLLGAGYAVGQTVFYDAYTAKIIHAAPELEVVELRV